MKKQIIITAVVSLIVGVLLTVLGYFVYTVIKIQTQVNQNTATLVQIVDFLNKANAQSATTAQTTTTTKTK
jgi:Tfp pilus assembly protein PilE